MIPDEAVEAAASASYEIPWKSVHEYEQTQPRVSA